MEEWKDVEGYKGTYQVSNEGRVRSLKFGKCKILSQRKTLGYYAVRLYHNGIAEHMFVHRLVANAFIPNPNNYPCVNHKNEDRSMNLVENLEWCTYKYNSNYGTRNDRIKQILTNREDLSKKVYQYTLDGAFVKL